LLNRKLNWKTESIFQQIIKNISFSSLYLAKLLKVFFLFSNRFLSSNFISFFYHKIQNTTFSCEYQRKIERNFPLVRITHKKSTRREKWKSWEKSACVHYIIWEVWKSFIILVENLEKSFRSHFALTF
jgi:hypothetical protein